jgi:hypothetical protein
VSTACQLWHPAKKESASLVESARVQAGLLDKIEIAITISLIAQPIAASLHGTEVNGSRLRVGKLSDRNLDGNVADGTSFVERHALHLLPY